MCIICSNSKIGDQYLSGHERCLSGFKEMERALLELSNPNNIHYGDKESKAKQYNKAHKMLVKIRKSLNDVEEIRETTLSQ